MWLRRFAASDEWQDAAATGITLAICLAWLLSVQLLVALRLLSVYLSRKLIHIFTGPIFMLTWNLFSDQPYARLAAAVVPLLITLHFTLVGLGVVKDKLAINSVTRRGDHREMLRGPVMYGACFVAFTIFFWRHSPSAFLALNALCAGDGFAELAGRQFGNAPSRKLPWSGVKSWPGSVAMLLCSFVFGFGSLLLFDWSGNFAPSHIYVATAAPATLAIAAGAAAVEALAPGDWDNVLVCVVVAVAGEMMMPLLVR
ncbi:hypothetical protein CLOM_g4822 [Closterium sp. NIES-68]|nr:hypothetical protein CLOM_g4822 [Closterium sp. NIES-68]GJP68991.1 hypothetical protein CLOP_g25623 [Closterium sp. NIES-67]